MTDQRQRTHIALLLDSSGSMQSIREDARGSYNAYLEEQQKEMADEAFWSLTLFGGALVERRYEDVPIAEMLPMEQSDYMPNGNTPLYDAMGQTMVTLEPRVEEGDRALLVVITDGRENSSIEWSHEAVEKKVNELTDLGNWTIVYLASTPDAVEIGRSLGVLQANASYFERGTESETVVRLSAATRGLRRSADLSSDSFAADMQDEDAEESES